MVLEGDVQQVINKVALQTLAEVQKGCPVVTGKLRNSIVLEKQTDGSIVIGTNLNYAEFVEIGVEPHIIEPKDKQALYWNGAPHPYKRVKHPGFDGRNMFLNASIKAEQFLKDNLK